MTKKILLVYLCFAAFAGTLMAAGDFSQLNDAGLSSKEAVQGSIKSWMWVTSLIPFALSFFLFFKVKEYQERQEEQGQYQPKVAKYASLVAAIIGGVVIMYIVYGIFGTVFLDKGFGDTWSVLVMDFFKNLV